MASHLDEVFGEEEQSEQLVGQANLQKLQDIHYNTGVREGINAGKESAVQDGFNAGCQQAFNKSHCIGRLRGVLRAIATYIEYKNHNKDSGKDITSLLLELNKIEERLIKQLTATHQQEVQTVKKQDGDIWEQELAEMWKKSKNICNEIGIDIERISASLCTSQLEKHP